MKKFQQISAFLLIALLALKVLVVPVIYLDFELRKDYIAKVLCENRNRPQLHCNGKCYLAKRLAAAQQKEQTEKGQELNRMLFGVEFLQEMINFNFSAAKHFYKNPNFYFYQNFSPQESIAVIFHPPSLF